MRRRRRLLLPLPVGERAEVKGRRQFGPKLRVSEPPHPYPLPSGRGGSLALAASLVSSLAIAFVVVATFADNAQAAETTLRLGKAQANQFAFIPADIGVDAGIFKKHGIDLEISAFARRRQDDPGADRRQPRRRSRRLSLASPAIVKGAPMKAVAVFSSAPNIIMLVVLKDGPLKTAEDLKGRKVSVSTAGSLTFWLTQQLSRRLGWGDDGITITPLGASDAQIAALMTHQIDGVTTDSVTVYKFVETGNGRVLLKYGDYFKDFMSSSSTPATI